MVLVRTARLVVHHAAHDDPFRDPGPWRDCVVVHGTDTSRLGWIGVRVEPDEPTVEVQIVIDEPARRQGYGAEALRAVVVQALSERAFVRVVAFAPSEDEAMQRVLYRAGLHPVAVDGDDLVYLARRS